MNSLQSSTPDHTELVLPLEEIVWGDTYNLLVQFTFPELPTLSNTSYLFQPGGTIFNALRQKGWTDNRGTPKRHFSINFEEPHQDQQWQYHLRFHYTSEPEFDEDTMAKEIVEFNRTIDLITSGKTNRVD